MDRFRCSLVGASHEVLVLARELGTPPDVVVDPAITTADWQGLPVLNDDGAAISAGVTAFIAAIDLPKSRRHVSDIYRRAGVMPVSLLHSPPGLGSICGEGLLIQRRAGLSVDCRVGRGVRLNIGANVMHNVDLGDYVTVAPNAVLLGGVSVGDGSYIGANAVVLPGRRIGRNCIVGAGAVVTRDVPDGRTVKGNPARQ